MQQEKTNEKIAKTLLMFIGTLFDRMFIGTYCCSYALNTLFDL